MYFYKPSLNKILIYSIIFHISHHIIILCKQQTTLRIVHHLHLYFLYLYAHTLAISIAFADSPTPSFQQ